MNPVLPGPSPETADGVIAAMHERLVQDISRHAASVWEDGACEHPWTTDGKVLLHAVWACVFGGHDYPIVLPGGDCAPAERLVCEYGLEPLVLRRLMGRWN